MEVLALLIAIVSGILIWSRSGQQGGLTGTRGLQERHIGIFVANIHLLGLRGHVLSQVATGETFQICREQRVRALADR